jgi:predicted RNA-binding protein associated with RNAse of E/G family
MSPALRRFEPGERIAIREVLRGRVWTSRPVVVVVEDAVDQFVSYLEPGTIIEYPVGTQHGRGTFAMWLSGEWELGHKEFYAPGMLRIAPAGQPFEVFAPVTPELGVTFWYVNLQQPLVRTMDGFDTMDETLDLLVAADFSSWERKDSDELELAIEMGVYSQREAQRILDSCVAVEKALERGEVPWDRDWRDWRPTPTSRD